MVGIAVGLLVVAGAATLTASQLTDNRRLLSEAQVMQDLRASTDVMTRELRRAGSRLNPEDGVWTPTQGSSDPLNWDDMTPDTGGAATSVLFRYNRLGVNAGQLGYRYSTSGSNPRVQTRMTTPNDWVDLTDFRSMSVEQFSVTPRNVSEPTPAGTAPQRMPCPKLCADGTENCWPMIRVREYTLSITGKSRTDGAVVRTQTSTVRPRNDQLIVDAALTPNPCPP